MWYQGFLGIQPDLERGVIHLAPRLPKSTGNVDFNARVGAGVLRARYEQSSRGWRYTWQLTGLAAKLEVDVVPFELRTFAVDAGDSLVVEQDTHELLVRHLGANGKEVNARRLRYPPCGASSRRVWTLFSRVPNSRRPGDAAAHPAMQQVRKP